MQEENPIKNTFKQILNPLLWTLVLASGIFLGATMFGRTSQKASEGHQKLKEILAYIDKSYVDTVNMDNLLNYTIDKLLEKLDPHSSYIATSDVPLAQSQLEGDFEGIGVEFNIFRDTLHVVAPTAGGPSEQAGIRAGDKIIVVDDKNIAGKGFKPETSKIFKILRGKRGSKVKLGILRRGEKQTRNFVIIRDKIVSHSVEVAMMLDEQTGFLKVIRFSSTTYTEFKKGLEKLIKQGMKRLVIDLRDNPGGYMDKAISMIDELLAGNGKIVYTKGKNKRFESVSKAKVNGVFEKGAVIVLINEYSASASEIVAGALQDHDRALIVGRRSFGKGLVQMPIDLSDGSELRLTISRYYTPSGRSIQKPFENYADDLKKRFEKGEMYSKDSIKFDDKKEYKTTHGRKVYGGGGITPDIFVPLDSTKYTYLNQLYEQNIIRQFSMYYAEDHKKVLQAMGLEKFKTQFEVTEKMWQDLQAEAGKAGIKATQQEIEKSKKIITIHIKALIAKQLWRNEGFYPIIHQEDEILQEALKHFKLAEKIAQ